MKPVRQSIHVPPRDPSMATAVAQGLVEVPMDGCTKMVVIPSAATFPNPVDSGSLMELGRSTVKSLPVHFLNPHLIVKEHGMTVGR